MSSSGLIYAVIVGAWAAYLVPMWLRRQDELNEARPTERFSTAIRLLSGRAGMERRYARDLRARSAEEGEPDADGPDAVTDSVDVRAFAMPPNRRQTRARVQPEAAERAPERADAGREPAREPGRDQSVAAASQSAGAVAKSGSVAAKSGSGAVGSGVAGSGAARGRKRVPAPRRTHSSEAAAARARRTKVLARRRRTTVMLFLAFTLGSIVAAVGGLAFLWAPGLPAVLLSAYIAYLRNKERRRFAYQMDRRRAEAAAQRLRERERQPRRRASVEAGAGNGADADIDADEPDDGPEPRTDPELSALAADRRALVEQTDHAEWVDQQRERQRRPGHGDSWDPVPVPLPTYVTAPVAPRATSDIDLGAPDTWSSARSSAVVPDGAEFEEYREGLGAETEAQAEPEPVGQEEERVSGADGRSDARRAASARRARGRGRTPLFDQYEEGERPRAANE